MIGKKSKSHLREKARNMLIIDKDGQGQEALRLNLPSVDAYPNILADFLGDSVWVAKAAKNKFYSLVKAAMDRPQVISHRDDGNMVLMTEEVYRQLLAGWGVAMKPRTLADEFRNTRITHPIERPNKLKQKRPRALDIAERIANANHDQQLAPSSSK